VCESDRNTKIEQQIENGRAGEIAGGLPMRGVRANGRTGRSKLLQHGRKIGVRIVFVYCLKGEWERVPPRVSGVRQSGNNYRSPFIPRECDRGRAAARPL